MGKAYLAVFLLLAGFSLAAVFPQTLVQGCTPDMYNAGDRVRVRKLLNGKYDVWDGKKKDCLAESIDTNAPLSKAGDTRWGTFVSWDKETNVFKFDLADQSAELTCACPATQRTSALR